MIAGHRPVTRRRQPLTGALIRLPPPSNISPTMGAYDLPGRPGSLPAAVAACHDHVHAQVAAFLQCETAPRKQPKREFLFRQRDAGIEASATTLPKTSTTTAASSRAMASSTRHGADESVYETMVRLPTRIEARRVRITRQTRPPLHCARSTNGVDRPRLARRDVRHGALPAWEHGL